MNDEERIPLLLETILNEVALIEKRTRNQDLGELKKELNEILQELKSGSVSSSKSENDKIDLKDRTLAEASTISEKVANHHYLWFFPDLKEWMQLAKRGRYIIALSIISMALLSFIGFNYSHYQSYKKSHYKYQYLFYASEDVESLRKYDKEWGMDSLRVLRMKLVDQEGLR